MENKVELAIPFYTRPINEFTHNTGTLTQIVAVTLTNEVESHPKQLACIDLHPAGCLAHHMPPL